MTSIISKKNPQSTSLQNSDLNFNLRQIIDNYLINEAKYEFDFFLTIIKQKQSNDEFISKLLIELKHLVDKLDPVKFENNLINILFFEIKWQTYYSKSPRVLSLLSDFLIDLNSAYTSYIYKCLTMLIKLFTISTQPTEEQNIDPESIFNFSHNLIINLVKIVPSSKSYIVKIIDQVYPYMIKETGIQEAYIKNLLKIAHYFNDLRLMLLEICIQKVLKIDVNSTREQILEAELTNDDQLVNETNDDQLKPMKHPLADRLDVMMQSLFDFIKEKCLDTNTKEFNWEQCKSIYKDLLFTFDKYILFTYGSSHAQFIMFYICSFRSMLSEGFLDYLWKKFSANNSCAITKQVCAYYIGSYLARAKYIPFTTCVATLQLMIKWIHNYIEKNGNNANTLNFDMHRTFYALCQTVFYVIIFRNRQLFNDTSENSKMIELVKSWKLNEIVSSKLNPLRYCLPNVLKKFAKISYINQIAYCYSIIDANNRTSIPISGQSTLNIKAFFSTNSSDTTFNDKFPGKKTKSNSNINENPLDSFFPFDPYLLNRSKSYVDKFFIEFKDVYDENLDESECEEDDDESEDEDDLDEDDNDNEDDDDTDMGDDNDDGNDSDLEEKKKESKKKNSIYMDMNDSDFENSMD